MELNNFIKYALDNQSNKNIEFEVRFGTYNRVSSNIKQETFLKILKLSEKKHYTFIKETIYQDKFKKRIIYDNSSFVKNLFSEVSKTAITESKMKDIIKSHEKYEPNSIHYVNKTKILKPVTKKNYKIDLVNEIVSNKPPKKSNEIACRYKMRCSWLKDMWMYDITILLFYDIKNKKSKVYFEVEIEYNSIATIKYNYTFDSILDCAVNIINTVTTIIECDSTRITNIDIEIMNSIQNSVVTLERPDINKLIKSQYAVVDKADGERKFIYIDATGSVYHINPTDAIREKILISNIKTNYTNTLIDCELINIKDKKVFYGFDILFYKGNNYRGMNLKTRLPVLSEVIQELSIKNKTFLYKEKKFYLSNIFKNANHIWKNKKKLFPYSLDGLIFTPINGTYIGHMPNFKWKDKHSIDVRIFYNKSDDFTEFYSNSYPIIKKDNSGNDVVINEYKDYKSGKIYYKGRIFMTQYKGTGLVSDRGVLGMKGQIEGIPNMTEIIEVEFLPDKKIWTYLRERKDKENPNSFLSIKSVMEAIVGNITIDEISKLKYTPSIYEQIGASKNQCFLKHGFNFISSMMDYNMCRFYTYAYKNILNAVNQKKSILVLGGDRCILNALIESDYSDITILEQNCLEVYGEIESEGYMGLKQQVKNAKSKIKVIWGSYNMGGFATFLKEEQKQLKNKYDTVFINSFETTFYNDKLNKFDHTQFVKYMNTLKQICPVIIGIFLSGNRITTNLEKCNCIIMRDSELHPLYKLYMDPKSALKKKDKTNIFKKTSPQLLEIQRMKNSYIAEYQPLVYDEDIVGVLKSQNIKIDTCKTLKSYYTEFKKNNGSKSYINDYDYIISDITRYFIAKF